ncbi:hypothetical protein D3C71_1823490 [compost metagenome]
MGHRAAEARAEGLVLGVVEVRLAAEEQHLVRDQRGVQIVDGGLRQLRRQLDVLHFAADVAGNATDLEVAEAVVYG